MKKSTFFIILLFLVCMSCTTKSNIHTEKITVACYYFPNYHTRDTTDLRISRQHFDNWSEWELIKNAKPRFEGHNQPKIPAWGYTDEKDPKVMEQKIRTASEYGIDVFIFDWYTYEGQPFLNRCLDEGFLKANNTGSIQFSLMWANHDWMELYPYTAGDEHDILYDGKVTSEIFDQIGNDLIAQYFTQPNYWLIDGKAYFSIYDIQNFIHSFGSVEATVKEMDKLNEKAIRAGLKGIHWNLVAWSTAILPGQDAPTNNKDLLERLGFDSATSYVWIHHAHLPEVQTDYNVVRDQYINHWDKVKNEYEVPYYPNVTMGWDSSPRTNQDKEWSSSRGYGYPYTNIISNNTPENFKTALQMSKDKLLSDPDGPRILNINCWNEWTEGSYLEPDTEYGYGFLEAVRDVFN
ncbi:Glycosyl hydrolase family 99-like domain [Proteiniphilum saccharofermentans]|uniref:Glycosyl hydrolase family 99-like domain n=1 Tax=Proteiniphilum saccharofermentans TaxID=1642647 RepID=A0A1R3T6V3_9BACT|nr:glycoside hydrolase family 99-like domain-containing protein [Proteiniphilum saccharofermentans]SCD21008.1 Glycosyl hydrolase family 99-like domain [Proteiniphilum saccharofermentans]SDZ92531.1 Glycosyltransferase WbsX [Porphyromonadaceae bacterium KH3R12]